MRAVAILAGLIGLAAAGGKRDEQSWGGNATTAWTPTSPISTGVVTDLMTTFVTTTVCPGNSSCRGDHMSLVADNEKSYFDLRGIHNHHPHYEHHHDYIVRWRLCEDYSRALEHLGRARHGQHDCLHYYHCVPR